MRSKLEAWRKRPRGPQTAEAQEPLQLSFERRRQDRRSDGARSAAPPVVMRLHDYDATAFADVAATFGSENFAYVVTPNVDHLIRFCDDNGFRSLYANAGFVLNDSRFLSRVVSVVRGLQLRVCTGSDLTEALLSKVVSSDDPIVLVGATQVQAKQLAHRYGLSSLRHYAPPMGFVNDSAAVETCLQFIESQSPFRFCFLALGCPQQEIIANKLSQRGIARGLTLCVGASINFLTGTERRAPRWMRNTGIEWLYRLMQDPLRMAKRYLVRGPRIFKLLKRIRFELLAPASSESTPEASLPLTMDLHGKGA